VLTHVSVRGCEVCDLVRVGFLERWSRRGASDVVATRRKLGQPAEAINEPEHVRHQDVCHGEISDKPFAPGQDLFARLGEFPVLMPTRGSVIRPFVERFLITHGIAPMPTQIETVSDSFGRAFVRQSDAIWIISTGVVADELQQGQLDVLPLDTSDTRGPVGLTMRTDVAPSPAFSILLQTIRDAAARNA